MTDGELVLPAPTVVGDVDVLRSRGIRGRLAFFGPAFVAAVAYVDPGNIAANTQAGAQTGYRLVWVVVGAGALAVLVQYLSAKLGVAADRSLPELIRDRSRRPVTIAMWAQAEVMAVATDLAEFVGAAVGLRLLFGLPAWVSALATGAVSYGVLAVRARGVRRFESAVAALLALVTVGFAYDLGVVGHLSAGGVVDGLVPSFDGPGSALLAAAIVGATIMPHAVYSHSALTTRRIAVHGRADRATVVRFLRADCVIGLGIAAAVNVVMLLLAVVVFAGAPGADPTLDTLHGELARVVGGGAALAFAVALLASGLASSTVGTYAGDVVMSGFLRRRPPPYARRLVTMVPSLVLLCCGVPATAAIAISQDVLAFGIPFALVPLVVLTARREVMGALVNHPLTTAVSGLGCALVVGLDLWLIARLFV